jgi:hypothetical protein
MTGKQDLLCERLSPSNDHQYEFTLEVGNLTSGAKRTKRARIVLPASGGMPIAILKRERA